MLARRGEAGEEETIPARLAAALGVRARVEAGGAPASLLEAYEPACRPVAQANADRSFENMRRLGEISQVIGNAPDLATLEARLASLSTEERGQLEKAIEAQRDHFAWDGRAPVNPET